MSSHVTPGPWPDAHDIRRYAENAGVRLTNFDLIATERAVHGAIAEFERRTGWLPFLSSGQDETRLFDTPMNSLLDLKGGLVSVTAVAVAGTAYQAGVNFWMKPGNAPAQGRPYTAIDFNGLREYGYAGMYDYNPINSLFYPGTGHQSVSVTGRWGFCAAVPFDVAQAVIGRALGQALGFAGSRRSRGLQQWEEGGVSEKYADRPFGGLTDLLSQEFESVVATYRRIQVA